MDQDLLRPIPLFSELTEQDRAELVEVMKHRKFASHETIFWIGERGDEMFIIQHGKVLLSYVDDTGHDIPIAHLGHGQFFGELSLLDGGPRTATARTEIETTLITLDRRTFYDFLDRHPSTAVHMVAILGARQRESIAKLRTVKNVNEEVDHQLTPLQKVVDQVVRFASSGRFFVLNIVLVVAWIAYHTVKHFELNKPIVWHDDPPTFFWLCLLIALESILLTILVLNAQRRANERSRIRDELEYQINLKAQTDVTELHRKIDRVVEMLDPPREL